LLTLRFRGKRFASRTDLTYRQRVDHLTGAVAGGKNAPYFLNSSTVHDDQAADTQTGSSGADLFFASFADRITGKKSSEVTIWS
jgi:hypothetical protein